MIRAVLVFWILAVGVGCSSTPDVVEEDDDATEISVEEHADTVPADVDEGTYGMDDITRLDDERVPAALLIFEGDESTLTAIGRDAQDVHSAAFIIEKTPAVFEEDIYFDFDRRIPQQQMLKRLKLQVKWLRAHADAEVLVAGHCDIRGSREYNMVLGEKRAQWIKTFFMKSGVNGTRINFISYGKERPNCLNDTEACHSENRRAHIVLQ